MKRYVGDYNRKVVLYIFICECKLIFTDLAFIFQFKRMYNVNRYHSLRPFLIT